MRMVRYPASVAFIGLWLSGSLVPAVAEAKACGEETYRALRSRASVDTVPVAVACDIALQKADVITMPVAFSGGGASGHTLDCNGATLDGTLPKAPTILIQSIGLPDGSWDAPRDIAIRNCVIKGDVRIRGLGQNGEAEAVRLSSLMPGHTERAQAAAPSRITLSGITFVANGGIPLYAAPGVTAMTVENSQFTGKTGSVAVYLDAESARNRIVGNVFDIRTASREVVAVDGSAENRIENNTFEDPVRGGIFLYRNCGEGGTVRHQAPERNVISGNTFRYTNFWGARPAIWLGSRQGNRSYCFSRPDLRFGSSLSPYDHARHNVVTDNRLPGGGPGLILDDDEDNTVSGNR